MTRFTLMRVRAKTCDRGFLSHRATRRHTNQNLASERNVPCAIDCRMCVRLPLALIVCRVEIVFHARGWQKCVSSRAPEKTTAVTVELLHHSAPLREVRSHCRPTELAIEFAEVASMFSVFVKPSRRDSHSACRLWGMFSNLLDQ